MVAKKMQVNQNGQAKPEAGQGLVEYGLILLVVSVVSLLLIGLLSEEVRGTFRTFIDNNPAPPPGVAAYGGEYAPKFPTPTPVIPPPNPIMVTNPDPPIITSGQSIDFQSLSTASPGNAIVNITWDFGDGSPPEIGTNVSHVFTTDLAEETYTVVMTVTDDKGLTSRLTREIGVETTGLANLAPIVDFVATSPTTGPFPLTVSFESQSTDPDGDPLTYTWSTGDPSTGNVTAGPTFSHEYSDPGIYYARLTVVDTVGNLVTSNEMAIIVEDPDRVNVPPEIDGRVSEDSGFAPFSVDFSVNSYEDPDGEVKSFAWDFGDGDTYPRSSVTGGVPIIPHIYDQPGEYIATLTMWDSDDEATSQTFTITVDQVACGNKRIKAEYYMGINGGNVSNLTNSSKYPNSPDDTFYFGIFEIPRNYANNYGVRVSGYIVPPETGSYTFYIAGDDRAKLYLSTDDTEINKREIAEVRAWTRYRQWNRRTGQDSDPITLNAGQFYYVEAIVKERGGGDHLSVGWIAPGSDSIEIISGNFLCTFD